MKSFLPLTHEGSFVLGDILNSTIIINHLSKIQEILCLQHVVHAVKSWRLTADPHCGVQSRRSKGFLIGYSARDFEALT